ncbi:MAG: tripartite tricarboxylate transporter substrate binding protein [Betaproteobacteria bacterium]|nr:tripartite tricarboxylate transporter substrate binding protein [Betaproteobacteria bacterium]
MRLIPRILALLAGTLIATLAFAQGQAFPNRPIRMIVTAATGGITDIMARVMVEPMGRSLGQPLIVENRPGAGGNIGTEFVVKAPPDGYTLVIVNVGTIAIHRWIYDSMPFDPLNDLVPVAPVGDGASILAVHAKLPVRTLKEFIELAKATSRKLNYGSAGNGTMPHLSAEVFAHMTGTQLVHVPYKGANPAAVDLATGQIDVAFIAYGSMRAQMAAGHVRALAVGSRERLAALAEVPTFDEAGLPGYDVTNWFGVFAPKGTPRDVVATLNTHIGRIFDDAPTVKRLQDGGIVPMRESADAFAKRIAADDVKWRDVVRRIGVKAQ